MPDGDLYSRSKLVARQQMITKCLLCVIGNSDILHGYYTNDDVRYKEIMHHLNFSLYTAYLYIFFNVFSTVHHSIGLLHLPTLMHSSFIH